MLVLEEINSGTRKFHPHHKGEEPPDKTRDNREDQIECTNIFVVGGIEPPLKETRLAVIIIRGCCRGGVFTREGYHCSLSYFCAAV